ncbi:hypothetical protein F2Q70_00004244 [Brassica cretica]|uniref:Uncharacterized protein n=1 Tax=Brassica cretica TaxID=69181 RepID=A0A8S9IN71_BRACR|nr:hypothetical protein F2Q70_00004244 [Brassica cretica]
MRRIGPTIPRPHSLRSFAIFGCFDLNGIIDFPELVKVFDMFRLDDRREMRTNFSCAIDSKQEKENTKDDERERRIVVSKNTIYPVKCMRQNEMNPVASNQARKRRLRGPKDRGAVPEIVEQLRRSRGRLTIKEGEQA